MIHTLQVKYPQYLTKLLRLNFQYIHYNDTVKCNKRGPLRNLARHYFT